MTYENAKQFILKVIQAWQDGEVEKADTFYSQDVKGSLDQQQFFGFTEIKDRIQYLASHHQNRQYKLLDCVASENRIAIQLHYQALDTKLNEQVDCVVGSFYTLNGGGQIEKVEMISSKQFNYREVL